MADIIWVAFWFYTEFLVVNVANDSFSLSQPPSFSVVFLWVILFCYCFLIYLYFFFWWRLLSSFRESRFWGYPFPTHLTKELINIKIIFQSKGHCLGYMRGGKRESFQIIKKLRAHEIYCLNETSCRKLQLSSTEVRCRQKDASFRATSVIRYLGE